MSAPGPNRPLAVPGRARLLPVLRSSMEGAVALFLPMAWGRNGSTLTETWGLEDRAWLDQHVAAAHGRYLQDWGLRAMGEDAPEAPLLALRVPGSCPSGPHPLGGRCRSCSPHRQVVVLVDRGIHPRHRMRGTEGPPQLAAIEASLQALEGWRRSQEDGAVHMVLPELVPEAHEQALQWLRALAQHSALTLAGTPLPPGPASSPKTRPGWALGPRQAPDGR